MTIFEEECVEPPEPAVERRAANRLLVTTARRGGPWLAVLLCAAAVMAVAEVALPAVLGRAVDAALGGASRSWLRWAVVLVVAVIAFDALDDYAGGAATARSTRWLRRRLVRHVLGVGPAAAQRFPPGDLSGRLSGQAAAAGRVGADVVRVGADLAAGAGGVAALAFIDPWLCLTFALGLPVLVAVLAAFTRVATTTAEGYLAVQGTITGRLMEAVAGARTIAAAGTLAHEIRRVLAPLPELRRHGDDMWHQQATFAAIDGLLVPLLAVAVLAVAGLEVTRGRITPGEMLAATQYAILGASLASSTTLITRLARARAGARRASEVLALATPPAGAADLPAGPGRLELRGVRLHADGAGNRMLLDGIDLVVPGGMLYAVAGASGSGKSLLAKVAARLVDPDAGEVLLDGVALTALHHDALRRAVTCAFERPSLIGTTFADAIAFGVDEPPPEVIPAAAGAARADGFIRRLPSGYATALADAPISGGEAQRVGLARAFAHPGRLLVLDDVAASLDTVTEHEIGRVLTGELAGTTRLVVAHRASTAARADAVVWLEAGRVRAVGPHDVLLGDPAYRALFQPDTVAP